MNEELVINAANRVRYLRMALHWLEEYGVQIDGVGDGAVANIGLNFAHSRSGAEEVVHVLSEYTRSILPEIITRATLDCRAQLDACISSIREEVASSPGGG